jgi:L,D-transpeptidase catalytic domain
MSNLPCAQATIPEEYRRHIVSCTRKEAPGNIVVDTDNKFLYFILPKDQAIRYGVAVGEDGQAWSGIATVACMEEWPAWRPTAGEQARLGPLPAFVTGGPQNPMGARGLYLYSGGKDTGYRIHGTNQPASHLAPLSLFSRQLSLTCLWLLTVPMAPTLEGPFDVSVLMDLPLDRAQLQPIANLKQRPLSLLATHLFGYGPWLMAALIDLIAHQSVIEKYRTSE